MAKARLGKKSRPNDSAQPTLPGTREPVPSNAPLGAKRLLPMQQQIGDRFSDEPGEWEVATGRTRPPAARFAHVRVRRVDQPALVEERT
jgi:hypothetical protein